MLLKWGADYAEGGGGDTLSVTCPQRAKYAGDQIGCNTGHGTLPSISLIILYFSNIVFELNFLFTSSALTVNDWTTFRI